MALESDKFVTVPSASSRCIGRQRLVGECVHKIAQIVLKSRVLWSETEERLISRTFNFELEEFSTLRALVHAHLRASPTGDVSSPLHIDVSVTSPTEPRRVLLERWSLDCERRAIRSSASADDVVVYKRMILLLRSLFSLLRILPAFSLYLKAREARQKNDSAPFSLSYSLSSEPNAVFSSPPSNLVFTPVDTASGRLHLSVFYRSQCNFGFSNAQPPMHSLIIQDYVGSPSDVSVVLPEDNSISLPKGWRDSAESASTPPFATGDTQSSFGVGTSLHSIALGTTPPFVSNPSVLNSTPPSSLPLSVPPLLLTGSDRRGKAIRLTVSPFKSVPSGMKRTLDPGAIAEGECVIEEGSIAHKLSELGFAKENGDDLHAQLGLLIEAMQVAPDSLHMFSQEKIGSEHLLSQFNTIISSNLALQSL